VLQKHPDLQASTQTRGPDFSQVGGQKLPQVVYDSFSPQFSSARAAKTDNSTRKTQTVTLILAKMNLINIIIT
jgi:hypothetical protein